MTIKQGLLLVTHGGLALAFVGYTMASAVLYIGQAQSGYISEGAKAGLVYGSLTFLCVLLVLGGVVAWARTGHRRYPLIADAVVLVLSWTALLVLIFFDPTLFVIVLALTLVCVLLAASVPGPRKMTAS